MSVCLRCLCGAGVCVVQVSVWGMYLCRYRRLCDPDKSSVPLELELQVVVRHPAWVLVTQCESSGKGSRYSYLLS